VICEIMSDDGSMARLPELLKFSRLHGLKIARSPISSTTAARARNWSSTWKR